MTNRSQKPVVFLGLSGGVDSAVAAVLLLEQGYDVRGVFLKIWSDTQDENSVCPWVEERRDAAAVAAKLGIPFETVDFEEQYRQEVFSYFVREYTAGRTPNPDILCNTLIKFGSFLDYANQHGADYIATGHHVRREPESGNHDQIVHLLRGIDDKKDQSYFLAGLTQEQLHQSLFPVGYLTKEQVREKAAELGLDNVADKPSTKGICFVGDVDLKSFLSRYTPQKQGEIVDTSGSVVGAHDGVAYYTIGQRKGLEIPASEPESKPYFVVEKDARRNQLVVSNDISALRQNELSAADPHWISGQKPDLPLTCKAKVRYNQPLQDAAVSFDPSNSRQDGLLHVRFNQPQRAVAPGQVVAFYNGDKLLGSAIIS